MNKWIPIVAGALLLSVVALVVYSQQQDKAEVAVDEDRLAVVASFYPLAYLAERVGGNRVTVTNLTPYGVSSHEYREKPSDIQMVERAALFVYHGQEQDPFAEAIADSLSGSSVVMLEMMAQEFDFLEADDHGHSHDRDEDDNSDKSDDHAAEAIDQIDYLVHEVEDGDMTAEQVLEKIDEVIHDLSSDDRNDTIRAIDGVVHDFEDGDTLSEEAIEEIEELLHEGENVHDDDQEEHEDEAEHGEFDPHIWLDLTMLSQMTEIIRDALIELDADNAETYRTNATALIGEFAEMDNRYSEELSMCVRRTIVVPHNAFSYLGRRYSIDILAIAGISPESEPSAQRLAELTDLVREESLTHIFFETLASPRIAETLAREVGAQTLVLNPVEGLAATQANAGVDFLDLVAQNLDNLNSALDCR